MAPKAVIRAKAKPAPKAKATARPTNNFDMSVYGLNRSESHGPGELPVPLGPLDVNLVAAARPTRRHVGAATRIFQEVFGEMSPNAMFNYRMTPAQSLAMHLHLSHVLAWQIPSEVTPILNFSMVARILACFDVAEQAAGVYDGASSSEDESMDDQ